MKTLSARIHQIRLEAQEIVSLELRPSDNTERWPAAGPGAHVDLHLAPGLARSYSLVEATPQQYVLAVLRDRNSRGGSRHVHEQLRVGQTIEISHPRNHFVLDESAEMTVLLAGGIGITPLYAMLKRLAELGRRGHLIYCARSRGDAAFIQEISTLCSDNISVQCTYIFDDENGGPPDIAQILSGYGPDAHYYCCGPARMIDAFESACQQMQLPNVHVERFAAVQQSSVSTPTLGYTVELRKTGKSLVVPAGANLLDSLIEAGCSVSFSCHEGVCGSCETRVLEGDIEHRDGILTRDERAANKSMMVCVSTCRSSKLVLDM
jgi:ferredoxin-NADP reductase